MKQLNPLELTDVLNDLTGEVQLYGRVDVKSNQRPILSYEGPILLAQGNSKSRPYRMMLGQGQNVPEFFFKTTDNFLHSDRSNPCTGGRDQNEIKAPIDYLPEGSITFSRVSQIKY